MLPHYSAIIFDNLEDAQALEQHIHDSVIADGGSEVCWCSIKTHTTMFIFTEYAVTIKDRVLQYLTDEQLDQIETLDESWFPKSEEE